jgi:flavin reductase (DIM6/NTAB) family NADH-FMN oxidoreductase RutF
MVHTVRILRGANMSYRITTRADPGDSGYGLHQSQIIKRCPPYFLVEKIIMDKITLGPMPYMSIMPTVLVGANVKGKPNYMTAAWATVACMAPPMVCVALNKARYTVRGIEENKTFSLNVPSSKHLVETDHCGLVSGEREDKSKVFASFYGTLKTAPLAEECPVNIECRLFKSVDCGSHLLYIGEVLEIHADKACVTDGKPDTAKSDPIVYAGASYWHVGKPAGRAFSIGREYRKK